MSKTKENLDVTIWRGDASGGEYVRYAVPREESQTILDVVYYVQRHLDPKLSYRYACRVGMCGSCAMMINGKPRWTCRTHVEKVLIDNKVTIEPLRNVPVIKDLACDLSEFFIKWRKAEAIFHPTKTRDDDIERILPDSPERKAAAIECINCAVCYAACDVVEMNPEYLGPAALNRAWTLVNDVRDGGHTERLRAVASDAGCHNCHS